MKADVEGAAVAIAPSYGASTITGTTTTTSGISSQPFSFCPTTILMPATASSAPGGSIRLLPQTRLPSLHWVSSRAEREAPLTAASPAAVATSTEGNLAAHSFSPSSAPTSIIDTSLLAGGLRGPSCPLSPLTSMEEEEEEEKKEESTQARPEEKEEEEEEEHQGEQQEEEEETLRGSRSTEKKKPTVREFVDHSVIMLTLWITVQMLLVVE